jgi:hypothetical protein
MAAGVENPLSTELPAPVDILARARPDLHREYMRINKERTTVEMTVDTDRTALG